MGLTLEVRGSIPEIIRNDRGLYRGNLKSYFRAIFYNAQNLCNPYHNFRHICHVMYLCYRACAFYSMTLSKVEMRNLLIAALFHDFDHSGKMGHDAINIARAIAGLEKHLAIEDAFEFKNIVALIKATEYPYTIPSERVSLSGQIIRDADLSQALSATWIQQVIFGLATEWHKAPLEVLKAQGAFYSNLKFHTAWGQETFPKSVIEAKIAEARELVDLLTSESVSVT